jgi:hypothetical protein
MLDRLALMLRWLRALCRLRSDLALENLVRTSRYGSNSPSCLAAIHTRD